MNVYLLSWEYNGGKGNVAIFSDPANAGIAHLELLDKLQYDFFKNQKSRQDVANMISIEEMELDKMYWEKI